MLQIVYCDTNSDCVLTCLVTKQSDDKNKKPGCHPNTQRFMIPANNEGFIVDIYLELLRLKEWKYADFSGNTLNGEMVLDRSLSAAIVTAIRECYKKLERDAPPIYFPLLTK